MNVNFNYFFYPILILCLLSCTTDLDLADTWEGERMYIDAELKVGDKAQITISRTFNPILASNPDDKYITDAKISMYRDSILYSTFLYDTLSNSYISGTKVADDACYSLKIETKDKVVASKEICIPKIHVNIGAYQLDFENPDLTFEGYLEIIALDANILGISTNLSSNLFMQYSVPPITESNDACFVGGGEIEISCLESDRIDFRYQTVIINHVPSSLDSCIVSVGFVSEELTDLRNENKYKNGEFEVNGAFNSSFDNGAYGIFGYTYNNSTSFSFY